MKIAWVMFPLIEIGGIATYVRNLTLAWQRQGHKVVLYHATPSGRLRNLSREHPVLSGRYVRLPGEQLAYGSKEDGQASRRILARHDLVIFAHQCPHPNIRGEGSRDWQRLYRVEVPKFAVWHDNIWRTNYPWFTEVADKVDVHLYTNPRIFEDSGQDYPGLFTYTPHPLDTSGAGLFTDSKRERIVWLPQWKGWKGIKHFAQACERIEHEVRLYNSGIEYYYLRKEPWWPRAFKEDRWDDRVEVGKGDSQATIYGTVLPERIPKILKRANVSVDLLGFSGGHSYAQHSYVQVESMVYGAVVYCTEAVIAKPSPIPEDCVVVSSNPKNPRTIARELNSLMADRKKQKQVAKRALEFVKDRYDVDKVAQGILNLLDKRLPHVDKATRLELPM